VLLLIEGKRSLTQYIVIKSLEDFIDVILGIDFMMLEASLKNITYSIGEREKMGLIEFYKGRREDERADSDEDK
jgi:hypothetical protein